MCLDNGPRTNEFKYGTYKTTKIGISIVYELRINKFKMMWAECMVCTQGLYYLLSTTYTSSIGRNFDQIVTKISICLADT